jgi:hypothetical protein
MPEHSGVVAWKRWADLSPAARRLITVAASVEGVLKIAALIDLARRPSDQIRGTKTLWAAAIIVINSAGVVPIAYFSRGRRRYTSTTTTARSSIRRHVYECG